MTTKFFEFDALIKKHEGIDGAYVEFPYDVVKEFGKSRVKIKASFDGNIYRGSLVRMGGDCHWLGLTMSMRKIIGKNPGDTVHVILEEDREERNVEIPADLEALMKEEKGLTDFFNSLSYTHRKEYVRWIIEARKEETRKRRLIRAIEMLKAGTRTPD